MGGLESFLPMYLLCMGTICVSSDTLAAGLNLYFLRLCSHMLLVRESMGFPQI